MFFNQLRVQITRYWETVAMETGWKVSCAMAIPRDEKMRNEKLSSKFEVKKKTFENKNRKRLYLQSLDDDFESMSYKKQQLQSLESVCYSFLQFRE